MSTREPVFEKSRSIEDLDHMRLMVLLKELVRDKGVREAAGALGVDHRTLTLSLERGRLSRRMRVTMEKALLEGGGSPAVEQRERNDALEGRLEVLEKGVGALGKDLSRGLAVVQGDAKAFRGELDQMNRRLARLEAGKGDQEEASAAGGTDGSPPLRREYPDLVTLEPAEDDEEVFGQAWPLIAQWRELKAAHPDKGRSLSWLATEEKALTLELELLEEHGMTLPPEKQPLWGFARKGQINWRRTALYDTRRARARRELLRKVLTLGLWSSFLRLRQRVARDSPK